ncbi:MAG: antitoxin [Limisphaerales bacterium]
MRTTLTLEADVARELKAEVRRRRITIKEAVNSALRAGLGLNRARGPQAAFVVKSHQGGGWLPGIDPRKLNKLAAELEDEGALGDSRRR